MTEPALRAMTIEVTEDDISNGVRGDAFRCPVAIAINRHLKGARASVSVSIKLWKPPFGASFIRLERPGPVKDFVLLFDKYGAEKARPFAFHLYLPEKFIAWHTKEDED